MATMNGNPMSEEEAKHRPSRDSGGNIVEGTEPKVTEMADTFVITCRCGWDATLPKADQPWQPKLVALYEDHIQERTSTIRAHIEGEAAKEQRLAEMAVSDRRGSGWTPWR